MNGKARILLHYDRTELFHDRVAERFPGVELRCCASYADLPEALDAFAPQVLFCIKFEDGAYPREAVLSCQSIRWVSVGGAGVDHLAPWDAGRVMVTNAAGVASRLMAEYVMGGMLALATGLPGFMRRQRDHHWQFQAIGGIAGKCLLVVGLGHTGREVARLAGAMGMRVIGTRANPVDTACVEQVYAAGDLLTALPQADYVVLSVPLVQSTRHLLDAGAFAAMKNGACLVDVSRGGVVDQAALAGALAGGRLGGAVLDVFEHEPLPAESPLWDLDNVIITPHCSSVDEGWERRAAEMFCDNLQRWLDGEALSNVVEPARGY